ncbi:hypothetical protein KCTC52924_03680 [Arenibacter antarcticus]
MSFWVIVPIMIIGIVLIGGILNGDPIEGIISIFAAITSQDGL